MNTLRTINAGIALLCCLALALLLCTSYLLNAFVAYDDSDNYDLNLMFMYAEAIERARAAIAKHQKQGTPS